MSRTRRIALFGGTFDPIHQGHLEIAKLAVEAMALDEVRFLPCRISPHKSDCPPTPACHRLEMIRLSIKDLPWAVADDFELHAPEPSFSFLTAEEMNRRYPDSSLFWLMGRDQWDALPLWRESGRLAAVVEFIVFARDGRPTPRPGMQMHFIEGRHPASATAVRQSFRDSSPGKDWLAPMVADYILKHQIYTG